MKTCNHCGESKTKDEFAFHPQGIDRLTPMCRKCMNVLYTEPRNKRVSEEYFSEHATFDEVRLFVEGLNIGYRLSVRNSGSPKGRALIKRYNREHPDRPYVRFEDRKHREASGA